MKLKKVSVKEKQKREYLKTHLTGEVLAVESHWTLTTANYAVAWELLLERYENERKIIYTILDKTLKIDKLNRPSSVLI